MFGAEESYINASGAVISYGALGPIRTDGDFRLALTRRVQSASMRLEQIIKQLNGLLMS